eukprot:NODE_60_length_27201_cov_1.043318.p12 type:complete len:322 gc:universal NODE_60_length_27201_cov_1.043318:19060-18095(-)
MGQTTSSSEEIVDFQLLDNYFEKEIISKWLKKEEIQLANIVKPILDIYSQNTKLDKSYDLPIDSHFESHLKKMLDYHFNRLLKRTVPDARSQGFEIPQLLGKTFLLKTMDVCFLQCYLPENCRKSWKVIYNSKINGESWSQFLNSLLCCPSLTLILIRSGGKTFGAYMSSPWVSNPGSFFGTGQNYLFNLHGKDSKIYKPTYYNENYAYLSVKSASCINGMGFGGQLEYFGLFLKDDFTGNCFAKPTSSTYSSPQFTSEENFKIDQLEAISVFEYDPEEFKIKNPNYSPFSRAENMEFLEMAGFEMHSKSIPPPVEYHENN